MIKRLLALDGVQAVARFRDDGTCSEGYGAIDETAMKNLCKFALDYKRMTQGNADQLSMFTGKRGWTPPAGWQVRGRDVTVCSVGSLVCLVENKERSLNQVLQQLEEMSHY